MERYLEKSSVCIIPVKKRSTRIPEKNFRTLAGKPLYQHLIGHVIEADCFDEVFIDTDSQEIAEYAKNNDIGIIERKQDLALDSANGNDLLVHHQKIVKGYDLYFQLFVTAPFLLPASIVACKDILANTTEYDSIFTATEEVGWFWRSGQPVNFRPGILPRSQDVAPLIKESTGLYGITTDALERFHSRIGAFPYIQLVSKVEAVDLDTEDDFIFAEYVAKVFDTK